MTAHEPSAGEIPDQVFAETRLWPDLAGPTPVIVVGLPRSGTSFLSHVLSQLPDYYVFDDLYLMPHPEARKAGDAALTPTQLDKLLYFLGWQIRARHRFGTYALPAVGEDRAEDLNDAIRSSFHTTPGSVTDLQAEWLLRLAQAKGAQNWGFKLPKAFLQAPRLFEVYKGAQLVFVMRQPEDVLASYKNMPDDPTGDGDPRRYHPLFYALYWRMAARAFGKLSKQFPGKVHLVKFQDLIADPLAQTNRLAEVLGTQPAPQIDKPPRANSSYRGTDGKDGKAAYRPLTGLEARVIRLVCGPEIAALGFETRTPPPLKSPDLPDLLRTTGIWAAFHARQGAKRIKSRVS